MLMMSMMSMNRRLRALLPAAALLAAGTLAAHETPAGAKMDFIPPAPGSYQLERIMGTPQGQVLDSNGNAQPLSNYTTGKITLLSFIYTYCADANGCPLAYATFSELKQTLEKLPGMADKVRFVSISFDPDHDTPEVMRLYGGADARNRTGVRWHFLTTQSRRQLLPLLDAFSQDLSAAPQTTSPVGPQRAAAPPALALSHLLKVFLIDAKGEVREIYSPSFLLPPVVTNDIKTLLKESVRAKSGHAAAGRLPQ
jgi:cytochrome oxidase Cu insertion factor (SCO1/SenC/PrrC family)